METYLASSLASAPIRPPVPTLLAIAGAAGLDVSRFELGADARTVRFPGASAGEIDALLDAVYRDNFKIRPHEGERDYAFGAEWDAPKSPASVP